MFLFWQKENSCFVLFLMISFIIYASRAPAWLHHYRNPAGFSLSDPLNPSFIVWFTEAPFLHPWIRIIPSFFTVVLRGNQHVKHLHGTSRCLWDPWSLLISSCTTNKAEMELASVFHSETERIHSCFLAAFSSRESVKWQLPQLGVDIGKLSRVLGP